MSQEGIAIVRQEGMRTCRRVWMVVDEEKLIKLRYIESRTDKTTDLIGKA